MRVTGIKKNDNLLVVAEPTLTPASKHRIHNVFIVDASGSMGDYRAGQKYYNAIQGVNELLASISQDTDSDNNVMIVEFEGRKISQRVKLTEPTPSKYLPMGTGGNTPLNQAIGETLEAVKILRETQFNTSDKVLVNIFTDGGENDSVGKFANPHLLATYIKELENDGFTITFIGTKNEVNYAVQTLGMASTNTMVHNNTSADISRSFLRTVKARTSYSKSVAKGEDVKDNFYTKTVN